MPEVLIASSKRNSKVDEGDLFIEDKDVYQFTQTEATTFRLIHLNSGNRKDMNTYEREAFVSSVLAKSFRGRENQVKFVQRGAYQLLLKY